MEITVDVVEESLRIDVKIEGSGPPGKTPVRGVDYWTEEDQQEIINEVLEQIPGGGGGTGTVYTVEAEDGQTDLEALESVAPSPQYGDIGIVRRGIVGDTKSYTAYIYTTQWEAMAGNYSAENVIYPSDLTITATLGVHTPDSSGSKTLPTSGMNMRAMMSYIAAEEKNPSVTQPSVSVTSGSMGAKEVGTRISPQYSATLNPGSYQYGPATGVTATAWTVKDTGNNTLTTASGTFPEIQVIESTSYSITATAQHAQGAVPVTNIGNPYEAGRIQAGSKSASRGAITGYRNSFYGTRTDKTAPLDSAAIRALTMSNKALSNGATFNVSIPVGATQVIICYPSTLRDLTSVLDVNGLNAEIKSGFKQQSIEVEGANGYTAASYKCYTLEYANPNDTANTYKVTI